MHKLIQAHPLNLSLSLRLLINNNNEKTKPTLIVNVLSVCLTHSQRAAHIILCEPHNTPAKEVGSLKFKCGKRKKG